MNNIKGKHKTASIKCYYVIPVNPVLEESTHKLQHQLAVWCFLYSLSYFQTGLSPSQRTHKSRAAPPEPRHWEGEAKALLAAQQWMTRFGRRACSSPAQVRRGAGLGRWRQQRARVQGSQLAYTNGRWSEAGSHPWGTTGLARVPPAGHSWQKPFPLHGW